MSETYYKNGVKNMMTLKTTTWGYEDYDRWHNNFITNINNIIEDIYRNLIQDEHWLQQHPNSIIKINNYDEFNIRPK